MGIDSEKTWLTYAEAAKRVGRSDRAVKRWRREGMPMRWQVDESGQRYRVVELDVLLAWWRDRLTNWPTHQNRMRRAAIERGETPPPIVQRPKRRQESPSETLHTQIPPHAPDKSESAAFGRTEPESDTPAPTVDPLATMRLRGPDEYRALTEQLRTITPSCAGMAEYTADRVSPEDAERMAGICAGCPLLARCAAFAEASKPAAGFWAGVARR